MHTFFVSITLKVKMASQRFRHQNVIYSSDLEGQANNAGFNWSDLGTSESDWPGELLKEQIKKILSQWIFVQDLSD